MAKHKWEDIPVHPDAGVRDRLGHALFLLADFDKPHMLWKPSADTVRPALADSSKEDWRRQADRLLYEIAPDLGLIFGVRRDV